ncbi:unnamed protein product, partial [Polarella glacialis]
FPYAVAGYFKLTEPVHAFSSYCQANLFVLRHPLRLKLLQKEQMFRPSSCEFSGLVPLSCKPSYRLMLLKVDRLTGELQRLSGGPFSPDLLKALWGLPLEDQQDVLLGVTGSEGSPLETRSETAVRLWRLTADEILARGGQVLPVRRVANSGAFRPPTGGATRSATGAVRGGRAPPTGGADRGRSRSRSPSI